MFCTYLTTYRGHKMPPFYIGSTSISKVNSGYRGSVVSREYKTIWRSELRNNPHLFKTSILSTHQTRGDATDKENKLQRMLCVVKNSMYINMSYASPRGFTDLDKSGKRNGMYGKKHSDVSKQRMSKPRRVIHPKTEEFKQTMRSYYKDKTYEERFGNDRAAEIKLKQSKPKTDEHKDKQSKAMRNKPKISCEHCGRESSAGNYSKWHGTKCKLFTGLENLS
jgi:hypothetical protein